MKKRQRKNSNQRIVVRPVRRKQVDADRIALAYWLLAKRIVEDRTQADQDDGSSTDHPARAGDDVGKDQESA
jgi:hypothetical protein